MEWRGTGGWEPGRKGGGSGGGQKAGFPRWQEVGEIGKFCNIAQCFTIEKPQRGGSQQK